MGLKEDIIIEKERLREKAREKEREREREREIGHARDLYGPVRSPTI